MVREGFLEEESLFSLDLKKQELNQLCREFGRGGGAGSNRFHTMSEEGRSWRMGGCRKGRGVEGISL